MLFGPLALVVALFGPLLALAVLLEAVLLEALILGALLVFTHAISFHRLPVVRI